MYIGAKRHGPHATLPYYLLLDKAGAYRYVLEGQERMPDTLLGWHASGWRCVRHCRTTHPAVLGVESVAAMRYCESVAGWFVTGGAKCLVHASGEVADAWTVFVELDDGTRLADILPRLRSTARTRELEGKNRRLEEQSDGGAALEAARQDAATLRLRVAALEKTAGSVVVKAKPKRAHFSALQADGFAARCSACSRLLRADTGEGALDLLRAHAKCHWPAWVPRVESAHLDAWGEVLRALGDQPGSADPDDIAAAVATVWPQPAACRALEVACLRPADFGADGAPVGAAELSARFAEVLETSASAAAAAAECGEDARADLTRQLKDAAHAAVWTALLGGLAELRGMLVESVAGLAVGGGSGAYRSRSVVKLLLRARDDGRGGAARVLALAPGAQARLLHVGNLLLLASFLLAHGDFRAPGRHLALVIPAGQNGARHSTYLPLAPAGIYSTGTHKSWQAFLAELHGELR